MDKRKIIIFFLVAVIACSPIFSLYSIERVKATDTFSSGFETGDLTEWRSSEPTVTVQSSVKHSGTYSLLIQENHAYVVHGWTDGSLNEPDYNVTLYWMQDTIPEGTNYSEIVQLRQIGYMLSDFAIYSNKITLWAMNWANELINSSISLSADTWYKFQLLFLVDEIHGYSKLYLDDVLIASFVDINTSGHGNVGMVYVGQMSAVGTVPDCYYDDVTMQNIATESTDAPLTPMSGYNYTLAKNTTSNYVIAENGTVVYNNINPVLAFGNATNFANNTSLYVRNGTYTGDTSFIMSYCINELVVFNDSALFTLSNWVNNSVIHVDYCVNSMLLNASINGNGLNQNAGSPVTTSHGIEFLGCSGCNVTSAIITNVRQFGFLCGEDTAQPQQNGITNSTISYCGWNGISLGWGDNTGGYFATYNTIYNCSDVGISTWGANNCTIIGNYMYNLTTYGSGGENSSWGIALEYTGKWNIIRNNTILGEMLRGINIGESCKSNIVIDNYISDCKSGIACGSDGFNVITNNTIINYYGTGGYNSAIGIYEDNDIVSFNIINTNSENVGLSSGITLTDTIKNCSITNNTITVTKINAYCAYGIALIYDADNSIIEGNNIDAYTGIEIVDSTNNNNKLSENQLSLCTIEIEDSGTNTIINPLSSDNFTLTLCNVFDSSSEGHYIYSNTTLAILESNGVLNVNGANVTLIGNKYNFTMNKDYFVYGMDGTVTLTTQSSLVYNLEVSLISPTNTTYSGSNVTHVDVDLIFVTSGNDTFTNATLTVFKFPDIIINGITITDNYTITFTNNYTSATLSLIVYGVNGSNDTVTIDFTISFTTPEETETPTTPTTETNILLFILVLFFVVLNLVCVLIKILLFNIIVSLSSLGIFAVIGSNITVYSITGIMDIDIALIIFVMFCALANLVSSFIRLR